MVTCSLLPERALFMLLCTSGVETVYRMQTMHTGLGRCLENAKYFWTCRSFRETLWLMGTHTHLQCISTSGNIPPEWCKLKDSPGPPWGGCSCAASGERGSYHNTFDKSYIFICQVESEYTVHADTS